MTRHTHKVPNYAHTRIYVCIYNVHIFIYLAYKHNNTIDTLANPKWRNSHNSNLIQHLEYIWCQHNIFLLQQCPRKFLRCYSKVGQKIEFQCTKRVGNVHLRRSLKEMEIEWKLDGQTECTVTGWARVD